VIDAVRHVAIPQAEASAVLFVCGLHRSGTSLIHRCIARHPDVSGFHDTGVPEDEGQHLQTVYPPARNHGGPGLFGFDPGAHLTEFSPLVTDENRARLVAEWGRHWRAGARVYVEKSPPNLIRTRFLQALFPEASFVIVSRHPAAVAGATRKWSHTSWTSLVRHWAACHETARADARLLRRVRLLRYEDFVADPDGSLSAVYGWLGLPAHPAGEEVRPDANSRYFARWRSHAPMRSLDRTLASTRYDRVANRWGYSLYDLEVIGPPDPLVGTPST
jgi:sulfotransferase family protein